MPVETIISVSEAAERFPKVLAAHLNLRVFGFGDIGYDGNNTDIRTVTFSAVGISESQMSFKSTPNTQDEPKQYHIIIQKIGREGFKKACCIGDSAEFIKVIIEHGICYTVIPEYMSSLREHILTMTNNDDIKEIIAGVALIADGANGAIGVPTLDNVLITSQGIVIVDTPLETKAVGSAEIGDFLSKLLRSRWGCDGTEIHCNIAPGTPAYEMANFITESRNPQNHDIRFALSHTYLSTTAATAEGILSKTEAVEREATKIMNDKGTCFETKRDCLKHIAARNGESGNLKLQTRLTNWGERFGHILIRFWPIVVKAALLKSSTNEYFHTTAISRELRMQDYLALRHAKHGHRCLEETFENFLTYYHAEMLSMETELQELCHEVQCRA